MSEMKCWYTTETSSLVTTTNSVAARRARGKIDSHETALAKRNCMSIVPEWTELGTLWNGLDKGKFFTLSMIHNRADTLGIYRISTHYTGSAEDCSRSRMVHPQS